MILDTTFLIDLEREVRRQSPGRAAAVLAGAGSSRCAVCEVAAGELAEGYVRSERRSFERFMTFFDRVEIDREIAWCWSRLSRWCRERGQPVGDNDLWIAACAVSQGRPLVTRNTSHFEFLPGLVLRGY